MSKAPRFSFIFASVFMLIFAGCSKKETMEVDNETQSVVDYAIADQEFIALVPAIYQSALITYGTGAQIIKTAYTCDTLNYIGSVPRDTVNFTPNPVYIFNPSNQACPLTLPDGKIRSGKVSVRITGAVRTKDSQMILKLMNYTASGIAYSCDSMVVTTRESNSSFASFDVKLINGACKTGTIAIKYSFARVMTIYPKGDAIGGDAVNYVYGEAHGTNRTGTNFSTNVVQSDPLVKYKTCPYIVKGTMELVPQGFKARTINFGDGMCDEEGTFTVNENTVAFKLK